LPSDTRFNDRSLSEICELLGVTIEEFKQSRAYPEIFGLDEACGEARGEARGEAKVTLRFHNGSYSGAVNGATVLREFCLTPRLANAPCAKAMGFR
jgi:hypothetical protein